MVMQNFASKSLLRAMEILIALTVMVIIISMDLKTDLSKKNH